MSKKTPSIASVQNLVQLQEVHGKKILAISTLKIAEIYNKRHDNVLSKTDNYIKKGKISLLNFKESTYMDERGKIQKMYILDERAFHFVASGFTGEKAENHRMFIVDQFMKMREILAKPRIIRLPNDYPAEMNKMLNAALKKMRSLVGKDTLNKHFMALAGNVNETWCGDRGKGKELRQQITAENYPYLIKIISLYHQAVLEGHLHKKEINEFISLQLEAPNSQLFDQQPLC